MKDVKEKKQAVGPSCFFDPWPKHLLSFIEAMSGVQALGFTDCPQIIDSYLLFGRQDFLIAFSSIPSEIQLHLPSEGVFRGV